MAKEMTPEERIASTIPGLPPSRGGCLVSVFVETVHKGSWVRMDDKKPSLAEQQAAERALESLKITLLHYGINPQDMGNKIRIGLCSGPLDPEKWPNYVECEKIEADRQLAPA